MKNIIAGRGFHWQKKIDVKYWGKIDFIVKEKNLLAINEVKLEDYLKCVATSEMSQNCPSEFLISQTIVARSWILANIEQKHKDLNFDVCNDDCCQRYQGLNNCSAESIEAANSSYGKVLIYGNQICDTRYSKSCGGITENFENVWENKRVPYLRSVKDCNHLYKDFCYPYLYPDSSISDYIGSVDEDNEYYRWKFEVDNAYIITSLNEKYKIDDNLVKGCQSKVWLHAEYVNNKVSFSADASALNVSPSKDVSEFGIGIVPYLLRTIPNNSFDKANPYLRIHCLPTSLICL